MSKQDQELYRPLPNFLKIRDSKIEGQGLFTTSRIIKETCLGVSHVQAHMLIEELCPKKIFRTPLGGFINHSETPNCEKIRKKDSNVWLLYTLKEIEPEEELTLKYTFYTV